RPERPAQEGKETQHAVLLRLDEGDVRAVLLLEDFCRESLLDRLAERLERAAALDQFDGLTGRRVPSFTLEHGERRARRTRENVGHSRGRAHIGELDNRREAEVALGLRGQFEYARQPVAE